MGYTCLALIALSWAIQYPQIAAVALVIYVLRDRIPDPFVWLSTMGRMRALERQISLNSANVTARRDLARLLLTRKRPRRALALLDEARGRNPGDPDLLHLTGLSRLRVGDAEGAVEMFVRAVQQDASVAFGEPYLKAGDALMKLGRHEDARDAYEHYLDVNSSSVEGYFKLAAARAALGQGEGASRALEEALSTFRQLPSYHRRKQLGWWVRTRWAVMVGSA